MKNETDAERKRRKAVPETVTMIDLITEIRKLKSRIYGLEQENRRLRKRIDGISDSNPRIGAR